MHLSKFFRSLLSIFLLIALVAGILSTGSALAVQAELRTSVSTEEIDALFRARSYGQHPRILADAWDFTRIRQLIQTDEYMRVWYARMIAFCTAEMDKPTCVYEVVKGQYLLEVARLASRRIIRMSMAYQLSGEQRYASRAVEEMLAVCAFPDWNPSHFLDAAQMSYGVGIGYDWLYHYMTPAQRSTVREALYRLGIQASPTDHWYHLSETNWNSWCHGCISVAACAIYEDYPTQCAAYLADAVEHLPHFLGLLAPSGAFTEGPGYYGIGVEYAAIAFDTLETVLGTDFGLSDIDGVRQCGSYVFAANGNVRAFNYGDGGNGAIAKGAFLHWYANRFHMPELSVYQQTGGTGDEALNLLWYDPKLVKGYEPEMQQPDHFLLSPLHESIASFRSEDERAIYAAIKSGDNQNSHSDLDIGTFVLEAMGEIWMEDLGSESYSLPRYWDNHKEGARWQYYRKRTEGQNVILINPDSFGGQDVDAKCQPDDFRSGYDGGYATVDLTDAYDGYGASSVKRGLMIFDHRSRVLLVDEISCTAPSEIYWFGHTHAQITLSDDKKTAELMLNGKTLLAQIASPSEAVFSVMDAQPLPTSPNPEGQNSREGIRKLTIHLNNVESTSISVVFTPIMEDTDRSKSLPAPAIKDFPSMISITNPSAKLQKNAAGIYEIYTVDQLGKLAEMVNSGTTFSGQTLKLMNDLDLRGYTIEPIGGGDSATTFRGTFDGNGHVIKNLFLYKPHSINVALFGNGHNATIRNLGIETGTVFGKEKAASLLGTGTSVTVEHCYNRANVICSTSQGGGLIAMMGGTGSIHNSYNHSTVTCNGSIAGGLVGYLTRDSVTTITNSYHAGQLKDTQGRIGMIGFYNSSNPDYNIGKLTVTNCYSTQPLKSPTVADNTDLESYTLSRQLSSAGLVGSAVSLGKGYISDCEWINDGYPIFQSQCDTELPADLRLDSAAQLRLLAYLVNSGTNSFHGKTVYLTCDIDLDSREWVPIGGNMTEDAYGPLFRGTFDGLGHRVRNLRVDSDLNYMGFFGSVQGHIRNFGIDSGSVRGQLKIGGLAGYLKGTVSQCYNRATVQGSNCVGGLIGMSAASTISDAYNHASISSNLMAGGLVGYYSSAAGAASVERSYHKGALSGKTVGAMAGGIHASITDIRFHNCYTTEDIAIIGSYTDATVENSGFIPSAQLRDSDNIPGPAFHRDSLISRNGGYPILNAFVYPGEALPTLNPDGEGVYHIYNERELRALAYMVNEEAVTFAGSTVRLHADIDLEGREWIPIGGNVPVENMTIPNFCGTFDGGGHMISNLCITTGNRYVGLFGSVYQGEIKAVGIESGAVFGAEKVGGLAGNMRANSSITECYNKANISANTVSGGILGMLNGSNNLIRNCYNVGSVNAKSFTADQASSCGGIVGYYTSGCHNSKLINCYNAGVGGNGIVGVVNAAAKGNTLDNCYTLNSLPAVGTANALQIGYIGLLTPAELRNASSVLGQGYREDYFTKNLLRPVLSWENGTHPTALQVVDGVYRIYTPQDLRLVAYMVRKGNNFTRKTIALYADLDLENKPWLPIGGADESSTYEFRGSFLGRGYVIRNLNSVQWSPGYAGLFGIARGATIDSVGIDSGFAMGEKCVAGLVGYIIAGTRVTNCYNRAFTYGDSVSGGVVGMVGGAGCVVENCYNTGRTCERALTSTTGGVIGYLSSSVKSLIVRNCYNVGNDYGIISGLHNLAANAEIINCYSTGTIDLVRQYGSVVITDSKQVSPETLKGYASVLGPAFETNEGITNLGYPLLTWQTGTVCYHEYTTTSDGSATHTTACHRCGSTTTASHTWDVGTTVSTPTCTTAGAKKHSCTICKETKIESIPANGHREVSDMAVPATCTEDGLTEGKHCSTCNIVLTVQQTILATGHSVVTDPSVAANCTQDGLTEGRHCETCGEVLLAQETVLATGHSDTTPADNRCDICGARMKEAVLRFRTISLKGNIAINYYMDLSDEVAKDENAYMLFTMEDGEQIKVPASEGEYSLYQKAYYYSFSCAVSAKEMTDTVLCQFFWSGGQTEVYTYSVKTYADRILASSTSAKLHNLIYAMLNYGAASQIHFEYHTERLANAGQEVPDYTQITIDGYPVNTKQGTTLATYAGASLLLTSETTLRIFFTVDKSVQETFTVTYKGETLPLGIRYGKYYADIPDIGAKDLDEYFTLTISDGTETAEVSYSPLSYCASIIENAKGIHDRELQDVAAAMYLYNQAANAYFLK